MHLRPGRLSGHLIVLIDDIKQFVIALGLYIIIHVCPPS